MSTVCSLNHKRSAYLSLNHGFHSRNHVCLCHPADRTELSICSRSCIKRIHRSEIWEILSLFQNIHKAVCFGSSIDSLKKDVLYIHWVRKHLCGHCTGSKEIVSGLHYLSKILTTENLSINLLVYGSELSALVPIIGKRAVRILCKEGFHIVCRDKLIVKIAHLKARIVDVVRRRHYFEYYILHVATVLLLLEELLVCLIIATNLVIGNDNARIMIHREILNTEINVCGSVSWSHGVAHLKSIGIIGSIEKSTVLLIELLGIDGILKIIPILTIPSGLVGLNHRQKLSQNLFWIIAGLIHEYRILYENCRRIRWWYQRKHLVFTNLDTGCLGVLDEQILVHHILPCSVPDILLCLLVLGRRTGNNLINAGKFLYIFLKISIGDSLSVDFSDVILCRHRIDSCLKRARINDKWKKGQSNQNRDCKAKFRAYFFKCRHIM